MSTCILVYCSKRVVVTVMPSILLKVNSTDFGNEELLCSFALHFVIRRDKSSASSSPCGPSSTGYTPGCKPTGRSQTPRKEQSLESSYHQHQSTEPLGCCQPYLTESSLHETLGSLLLFNKHGDICPGRAGYFFH